MLPPTVRERLPCHLRYPQSPVRRSQDASLRDDKGKSMPTEAEDWGRKSSSEAFQITGGGVAGAWARDRSDFA